MTRGVPQSWGWSQSSRKLGVHVRGLIQEVLIRGVLGGLIQGVLIKRVGGGLIQGVLIKGVPVSWGWSHIGGLGVPQL